MLDSFFHWQFSDENLIHIVYCLVLFLLTACWKCLVLCDVGWLTPFWIFLWLFGSLRETSNTWRSFKFLSGHFYPYKQVLSKKKKPLVLSYYTVNQVSWKNKIVSLREHTDYSSVTSNHTSFKRTFCVKLKQQVCKSANGRFWLEINNQLHNCYKVGD